MLATRHVSAMLDVVMDARSITTWVATQISSGESWVVSGLVGHSTCAHTPTCAPEHSHMPLGLNSHEELLFPGSAPRCAGIVRLRRRFQVL